MKDSTGYLVLFVPVGLLAGMFGLAYGAHLTHTPVPSDVDCEFPEREPNEPPDGCHEICYEAPVWHKWGSRTYCYWDDEPPPDEQEYGA